jgi:hypothetical protein
MWRVLRKGGICCSLGEVAAGAPFRAILTSRIGPAGRRSKSLEVEEKVYNLTTWKSFFENCGFTEITIDLDKTWEHKLYHWFTALYYKMLSSTPNAFIGNFLPCNIDIYARRAN